MRILSSSVNILFIVIPFVFTKLIYLFRPCICLYQDSDMPVFFFIRSKYTTNIAHSLIHFTYIDRNMLLL